jgi:hypothetical protein
MISLFASNTCTEWSLDVLDVTAISISVDIGLQGLVAFDGRFWFLTTEGIEKLGDKHMNVK